MATGELRAGLDIFELKFPLEGLGLVADSLLKNGGEFAKAIQGPGSIPTIVYGDLAPTGATVFHVSHRIMNVPSAVMQQAARVAVGSAYGSVRDSIENEYGCNPEKWPKIIEYFRHLHNASSHQNTFKLVPLSGQTDAIDISSPPSWRTSTMPTDASMNSRKFVGDFLLAGDIPVLLGDVAEQLRADDIIK